MAVEDPKFNSIITNVRKNIEWLAWLEQEKKLRLATEMVLTAIYCIRKDVMGLSRRQNKLKIYLYFDSLNELVWPNIGGLILYGVGAYFSPYPLKLSILIIAYRYM